MFKQPKALHSDGTAPDDPRCNYNNKSMPRLFFSSMTDSFLYCPQAASIITQVGMNPLRAIIENLYRNEKSYSISSGIGTMIVRHMRFGSLYDPQKMQTAYKQCLASIQNVLTTSFQCATPDCTVADLQNILNILAANAEYTGQC